MNIFRTVFEACIMILTILGTIAFLIAFVYSCIFLHREYNEIVIYPWEKEERKEAKRRAKEDERARNEFWKNQA